MQTTDVTNSNSNQAQIDAAESTTPRSDQSIQNNAQAKKLGTKWGDEIDSSVKQVEMTRKSLTPISETQIYYANQKFKGKPINSISLTAGKISFQVTDDNGNLLPMYRNGASFYLKGKAGQSYQLKYQNYSNQTFEIVSSVDGLNVLDGTEASRNDAGYVLHPYDTLTIQGFRKSDSAVASFTFSQRDEAYAANSANGSVQNTGIIGTVVYELKAPKPKRDVSQNRYAPAPNAFPAG